MDRITKNPHKLMEWIKRNGKENFIKLLDSSLNFKEIKLKLNCCRISFKVLEEFCNSNNINYNFNIWKKHRNFKAVGAPTPGYVKWYFENGKQPEKLVEILDNSLCRKDVYNKLYNSPHPSRDQWESFKKWMLQFIYYNFDKWDNRLKKHHNLLLSTVALKAIQKNKKSRIYKLFSFHSKQRIGGHTLRDYLIEVGVEYKCVGPICSKGNGEINSWCEDPDFSLDVEHIDGNHKNNTFIFDIEKQKKLNPNIGKTNLCFLCPCCHRIMTNRKKRQATERRLMSNEDINVLNN